MASSLGKRKRKPTRENEIHRRRDRGDSEGSELDSQEIFRRHFETQFKPLPQIEQPTKVVDRASAEHLEELSDWSGISEGEGEVVQVVEHTDVKVQLADTSREELKAFMVNSYLTYTMLC